MSTDSTNKFEDILKTIGTGRWNVLFFAFDMFTQFMYPPQYLSSVYLAPEVGHTCIPPDHSNVTGVSENSCSYYVNTTTSEGDTVREEYPCTDWVFDNSTYESTLTSEFKLVCGRAPLRATYQGIPTMATVFTRIFIGYLSDRYGRKTVVIPVQIAHAIVTLCIVFCYSMTSVLVLRLVQGVFNVYISYTLALEVCELKYRSTVGSLLVLPWAFGSMAWGGMAYLIRDWRMLHLAVSLPLFLKIGFHFLIDESPRWLIVKGKEDKALEVLHKAARWNGTKLPSDEQLKAMFQEIQMEQNKEVKAKEEKKTIRDHIPILMRNQKLRSRTILISFIMFGSSFVYNGLTLSGDIYSADPFLYIVLGGIMELPSNIVAVPLLNLLGRKRPAIFFFLFCGVAVFVLAFIPTSISWFIMTLAMLGKFFNAMGFIIMFVYINELYPTEVRLQGLGVVMTVDCLGIIFAPYVADYLGPIIPWIPSVIFGTSSLVACFLLMPLPETKGLPMMETVEELERQHILQKDEDGQVKRITYSAASSNEEENKLEGH